MVKYDRGRSRQARGGREGNRTALAAAATAANIHDSRLPGAMLDAVVPARTGRLGIEHRIAGEGVEREDRPGRCRRVVERTMASLARYRRLVIRYERLVALHRPLLRLACALVRLDRLHRL